MLIEKCLTTLYQPCLQNIPLKAVVFSLQKKESVPGFLLQPLLSLRWQHLLVVRYFRENELAQTN